MLSKFLKLSILFLLLKITPFPQSTNQNEPTPVNSNQIAGVIEPRQIPDDRPTRYFYILEGMQGDLFINVETENFDGDMDLFIASNLKPLAKITLYSANTKLETGRVIYLRKPERLLLRIEGRTPNDLPARFIIKFAGSFLGSQQKEVAESEKNDLEKVATLQENEEIPKKSENTVDNLKEENKAQENKTKLSKKAEGKNEEKQQQLFQTLEEEQKTTEKEAKTEFAERAEEESEEKQQQLPQTLKEKQKEPEENQIRLEKESKEKEETDREIRKAQKDITPKESALTNMILTIVFKDGQKLEKSMEEISSFRIDEEQVILEDKNGNKQVVSTESVLKVSIERKNQVIPQMRD